MPIYNVRVTYETTLVVVAGDEDEAHALAIDNAMQAIKDEGTYPDADVRGEVRKESDLRDGWDTECVPYGGDGNTRLRDLLTPNDQHNWPQKAAHGG